MVAVLAKALGSRGSRLSPEQVVALLIEQAYTQLREMGQEMGAGVTEDAD